MLNNVILPDKYIFYLKKKKIKSLSQYLQAILN